MNASQHKPNTKEALELLQAEAEQLIAPLGYEIAAIEITTQPGQGRTVTLFIDFIENQTVENSEDYKKISLEDCVKVNDAVDQLFENTSHIDGQFSLDVSSPGVERPLRKQQDYFRFKGKNIRLNTFRSLQEGEIGNAVYWTKNKKQKRFVGRLEGLTADGRNVLLFVDGEKVQVPFELISKAHLEFTPPDLDRE